MLKCLPLKGQMEIDRPNLNKCFGFEVSIVGAAQVWSRQQGSMFQGSAFLGSD